MTEALLSLVPLPPLLSMPRRSPEDEAGRIAALHRYGILDTPAEEAFERWITLGNQLLDFPIVAINLIDERRSWTKAGCGLDQGEAHPRGESFCAVAISQRDDIMVVPDATLDPRFADNPQVAAGLRFYAGAPLLTSDGYALGAFCVADTRPRNPSAQTLDTLRTLAVAVSNELELRRQTAAATAAEADLRVALARREEEARSLSMLGSMTRRLARGTDADQVRDEACSAAIEIAKADGAVLLLRTPDGGFAGPVPGLAAGEVRLAPSEQSLTRMASSTDAATFVADLRNDPRVSHGRADELGASSAVVQPVSIDGDRGGVLVVYWREPRDVLDQHTGWLLSMLADEVAIALHRTELLAKLETLSRTDQLTGLPNRRALDEALTREVAFARRHDTVPTVAMIDLDAFKAYNDRYGHQAGDELLRAASFAWGSLIREDDLIARYGGEEFVVVFPTATVDCAEQVIERIRAALPFGATCSAGIARWDGREHADQLLLRADRALYEAKAAGRDRAVTAPA